MSTFKNNTSLPIFRDPKFQDMLVKQFEYSMKSNIEELFNAIEEMMNLDHMKNPKYTSDVYDKIAKATHNLRFRLIHSLPDYQIDDTVDQIVSQIMDSLSNMPTEYPH
ncbi:hypothetical protein EBS67_00010 [bacterium]|nr:hypothetical protein [bacterium]NBT60672.1 hypothetical protein [Planctomycetia bacterium]